MLFTVLGLGIAEHHAVESVSAKVKISSTKYDKKTPVRIKSKAYNVYDYPRTLKSNSKFMHYGSSYHTTTLYVTKTVKLSNGKSYSRLSFGSGKNYGYINTSAFKKYATVKNVKTVSSNTKYRITSDSSNIHNVPANTAYGEKTTHYSKNYFDTNLYITKTETRSQDGAKFSYVKTGKTNLGWIYSGYLAEWKPAEDVLLDMHEGGLNTAIKVSNPAAASFYRQKPTYSSVDPTTNKSSTYQATGSKQFKTNYFLTASYKSSGDWANTQGFVMHGQYLYASVLIDGKKGTGRIVRFDMNQMNNLNLNNNKGFGELWQAFYYLRQSQSLSYYKSHFPTATYKGKYNYYVAKYKAYKKYASIVKVGPMFVMGHGQSLDYKTSGSNQGLYMYRDTSSKSLTSSDAVTLQHISSSSLAPDKYTNMQWDDGYGNYMQSNNLTFADGNNFYSYTMAGSGSGTAGKYIRIWKGTMAADGNISLKVVGQLSNRVGDSPQSIAYSSNTNKLYLTTDDAFVAVDAAKLTVNADTHISALTASDVSYTRLSSSRETEGMQIINGYAYMLFNRTPELIKSTTGGY